MRALVRASALDALDTIAVGTRRPWFPGVWCVVFVAVHSTCGYVPPWFAWSFGTDFICRTQDWLSGVHRVVDVVLFTVCLTIITLNLGNFRAAGFIFLTFTNLLMVPFWNQVYDDAERVCFDVHARPCCGSQSFSAIISGAAVVVILSLWEKFPRVARFVLAWYLLSWLWIVEYEGTVKGHAAFQVMGWILASCMHRERVWWSAAL